MAGNLQFDVTANDQASGEFTAIAAQLKTLARQLKDLDGKKARTSVQLAGADKASAQAHQIRVDVDKLDGRNAKVRVSLDAASTAPVEKLSVQLRDLDGRFARANVQISGVDAAKAKVAEFAAVLRAIPNKVTAALHVDMDKSIGERLAGVSAGLSRFGSVASSAVSRARQFQSATSMLMDPSQLPIVERFSDAIASKFHAAVDKARVGVEKLSTGLSGMRTGLLGIAALGSATQVVGGLATSLAELSGSALLIPAAVGGAAVAVGTLKIAFAGFSDAVNADTPKKFAKATEDMAPAAKAAVIAVRELKTALSGVGSVGKVVQTNMFDGLAAKVQQLGQVYLPVLKSGLGTTATLFNGMAKSALTAVTSLSAVAGVRTIITNTNTALGAMKNTVANAATGFLTLAVAGSGWLPRFGAAVDAGAKKFDSWSKRIVADGSFDRWVSGGITAFKQIGTILGNVGSIAGTVFSALNSNGAGLLSTLAGLTGQLRLFLGSAQGSSALQSLAQTLQVVGDAASKVLSAALKQLGPIMTALAPAAQALAVALGANLVSVINAAGPVIERFAAALSANPALLTGLAHAATAVVVGFSPMVVVIGLVASYLKKLLLLGAVNAAMGALGLQGTLLHAVLQRIANPMMLLRDLFPRIATGVGTLAARLLLATGPIGALVVAFATLYASSSQFREAVADVSGTIGRLFTATLSQAGQVIGSTVNILGNLVSAVQQAAGGLSSFGSTVASAFGPLGRIVSGALSGLFDLLGNLPGAALAAFAAFRVFGAIAPIFTTAGLAVTAFGARLAAANLASGAATVAANASGQAISRMGGVIAGVGKALPIVAVAAIAMGAAFDAVGPKASEMADAVVNGSLSMQRAIQQEADRNASRVLSWDEAATAQAAYAQASDAVRGKIEQQLQAMNPLDEATARVKISQNNLNDAILTYGRNSPQAAEASKVLGRDTADLASKQTALKTSTESATDALKAQQDQMQGQVNASLAYKESVQQTAEAQQSAADAIKQNGAGSAEAERSITGLARAYEQQAESAQKVAGETGGASAAAQAYNLELLGLDRSSQAGKAAFTQLASGMSQTSLNTLSAAAAATGLRTEVLKLPGGKTVTVVVAADQAKLDEIKGKLDAFRNAMVSITIDANVDPVTGKIQATATLANGTTATIQLNGNPTQANGVITQTVTNANGQVGTMAYRADALQADGTVKATVTYADGTSADMTFKAADGPARGTIAGTVAWANGRYAAFKVGANASSAIATLNALVANWNGRQIIVNIGGGGVTRGDGAYATPRAAGAYAQPAAYAMGGLRPMLAGRAEMVPARQPRIIGDRMQGDEAFIPILPNSTRSQLILEQAVKGMGRQLVPRGTGMQPPGMAGSSIAGARAASAAMRGPVRGAAGAGLAVQIQMTGVINAVNALTALMRAASMPPEATSDPIVAQLAALRSELRQVGPAERAGAARVRSAMGFLA